MTEVSKQGQKNKQITDTLPGAEFIQGGNESWDLGLKQVL